MHTKDRPERPITILLADDDEEDRELAREALQRAGAACRMDCVVDGQELIDYLRRDGAYAGIDAPRPSIILLDLNMPRKDGREALAELKSDATLRRIPVVVLTTSKDVVDVQRAYELGANSYITKPVSHAQLTQVMQTFADYWSGIVQLPDQMAA